MGDDLAIQTGKSLVTQSGAMFKFVAAQTGFIEAKRGLTIRSDGTMEILGDDVVVKSNGNLALKGSKILQN